MSSLVDFITLTKGTEYLIAIGALFGFVAFWQWLQHRGSGLLLRVAPAGIVALGFGVLVSTCTGVPATATSGPESWPSVDDAHYLANIYGPAKFAAHEMGPNIVSCQTCHHHSPDGSPQPCKQCHSDPFDGTGKPGLKAAYHQRCTDCHKEAFSGPMTCTNCHSEKPQTAEFRLKSPSPAVPPTITHSLLDRYGNCITCHNPEGTLPLPGNHSGYRANVECLACHKPGPEGDKATLISMVVPRPPSGQAAPEPKAAASSSPTGPSKITHPVAGREDCLMCHAQGLGGAAKVPADHAGRANDGCQMCHKGT